MTNLKPLLFLLLMGLLFSNCKNQKSTEAAADHATEGTQAINGQEANWEYPFNGKSLDGWKKMGGEATYHVEGNMIVGVTAPVSDTSNTFLVTNKFYDNFVLEFEVLMDAAPGKYHNSGVQIRSNSLPDFYNGLVHGYQVEIDLDSTLRSGGIYDEGRRGWVHDLSDNPAAKKAFKPTEWNSFMVVADGPSIKTWVNGVPAADYVDSMTSTGFIGLQVHATDSEEPLKVKWRNIRIKPLQ